jgi:glycosyl hydrolase family 57
MRRFPFYRSAIFWVFLGLSLLSPRCAFAQNHSVHTSFLWHLHQPIYWPDKRASGDHYENAWDTIQAQDGGRPHPSPEILRQVFGLDDRIAAYQYRPKDSLSSITWLSKAGVQLNYSGALMENVQSLGGAGQLQYGSAWYQSNRDAKTWTTSGGKPRMDLTNFTYHHALAPLLSDETLEMELRIHKRHMQLLWGDPTSRGYFPAETCFSERMIPILKKVDIAWSIIANNHLSRACADFPLVLGSGGENCDIPNKADQLNPAQVNYQRLSIDRGMSPAAALPFAFQVHYARYVDPATGAESKLIVVPSDQALGWKDSYSTWDLGLLDPLNARNNPSKPALALMAHDGDNAWSGGYSYYMEWIGNFANQANGRGYEPTTIEQFLQDWPADLTDVVHVEDGGWVYADGDFGSPIFINWHFPPSYKNSSNINVVDPTTGVSDKADVWRVIVATENRVKTAQQISGITPRIDQVRDPGSFSGTPNNVELAWHYYLAGLDSGFVYFGCHGDECQRPVLAQSNAEREIGGVLSANGNQDTTAPTIFIPQRHPWNPGAQNYGVQYSYRPTTPPNTDFWIWTYAYDVSGVANVTLKYRSNGSNQPPTQDQFKTYAGGANTGSWNTLAMTKRVAAPVIGVTPQFIADYYYAKLTGLSDTFVDYYVTATDTRGNTFNSPIQHVYVASNPNGTPTPTPI